MNHEPSLDEVIARLTAVNPVDDAELAGRLMPGIDEVIGEITGTISAPDDFEIQPGSRTSDAVVVQLRRRRAWLLIAAAASVAVLVMTAGLAVLWPGSTRPAYAITVDRGVIVVDWMRDLRDGTAIAKDLRTYGVDAEVRTVAASPGQVGRILVAVVDGVETDTMPPGVSWGADGTDEVFTWRIDPSQFTGSIAIEIGVEPDRGDPYVAAESAFAPGEVLGGLHCALDEVDKPITAAAIDEQLRRLGLSATWIRVTEAAESTAGDIADNTPSPTPPAGLVLNVVPLDAHRVEVSVAPPGASPSLPIFEPVLPSAECTPELASRWTGLI